MTNMLRTKKKPSLVRAVKFLFLEEEIKENRFKVILIVALRQYLFWTFIFFFID